MPDEHRDEEPAVQSNELDVVHQSTWKGKFNSPVIATVNAVADTEGLDISDLPPLANDIDPDALDSLLNGANTKTLDAISFRYNGYNVVLNRNGSVELNSHTEKSR